LIGQVGFCNISNDVLQKSFLLTSSLIALGVSSQEFQLRQSLSNCLLGLLAPSSTFILTVYRVVIKLSPSHCLTSMYATTPIFMACKKVVF
jgi:hypothetical protein